MQFRNHFFSRVLALGALVTAVLGGCNSAQRTFDSPQAAVGALEQAVASGNRAEMRSVLGPRTDELKSGDAEQDRADLVAFTSKLQQQSRIENVNNDEAVLLVGQEEWLFPVPMVRVDGAWRFDTDAGIYELTTRRIGANELAIIDAAYSFIDAEVEYGAQARDASGVNQYTARLWSSPGTRDGLYWETAEDETPPPIGPAMAAAVSGNGTDSYPFYGYFFRALLKQGPNAVGGEMDYAENGRLVKGIAGVAFPAEYGQSGIMTFIFSMDGAVYQRDLGAETSAIAGAMDSFDPGEGWTPVAETVAVEGGE